MPKRKLALMLVAAAAATFFCSAAKRSPYSNYVDDTTTTMQGLRDSLDMLRHQLDNQETEIRRTEEKLNNQELIIDSLRHHVTTTTQAHKDLLQDNTSDLEMKFGSLDTTIKGLTADLRQIRNHANETSLVISQSRQKLVELEKIIEIQNQNIENLQSAMRSLMEALQVKAPSATTVSIESERVGTKTYKVQAGDSLEKIAKKQGVSLKELKELNGLTNDKIIVGQTLKLP